MISQIERGRSGISSDGLANAALELEVSADYLLGLTDDPAPVSPSHHVDHIPDSGHLHMQEEGTGYSTDIVHIPQVAGISASNLGNVALSELKDFPVSQAFLADLQINPAQARTVKIHGQSMYPALPGGSVALVDLGRKWLKHNLICLIIINFNSPDTTYEVRRLMGEDSRDFQWHTDFYLDLTDHGIPSLARSWRREMWHEETRANLIRSRDLSMFAPTIPNSEVAVVGHIRAVFHIFDDDGW